MGARTFRWAILRLSIIIVEFGERLDIKTKQRCGFQGVISSRVAKSAGWEEDSRQASPFQGREPPSSRRRRGERRSEENHSVGRLLPRFCVSLWGSAVEVCSAFKLL